MKLFLIASGGLFVCWEAWHCSQKETERKRKCLSFYVNERGRYRTTVRERIRLQPLENLGVVLNKVELYYGSDKESKDHRTKVI